MRVDGPRKLSVKHREFFRCQNANVQEGWWICISTHVAGNRVRLEAESFSVKDTAGLYSIRREGGC